MLNSGLKIRDICISTDSKVSVNLLDFKYIIIIITDKFGIIK